MPCQPGPAIRAMSLIPSYQIATSLSRSSRMLQNCYVLTRADDLATMTVLDEASREVVLGTLWAERTAVLAFVRHFG